MNRPESELHVGVELLQPYLAPYGFAFTFQDSGTSSGGEFAWGDFRTDGRWLELHVRHSLGLVSYSSGTLAIGHEAYLRALGVAAGSNEYPSFSTQTLEQFGCLARDISRFLGEFLNGELTVFNKAAPTEMARLASEHRVRSAGYEGDDTKRANARQAFFRGDYRSVVKLLESLHYPDLLHESERQLLSLAQKRAAG